MITTTTDKAQQAIWRLALRLLVRPFMGPPFSLAWQRRWAGVMARIAKFPAGATVNTRTIEGVPVEELSFDGETIAAAPPIVYLHGGAYCLGGPHTHRALAAHLSRATLRRVVVPDYRLAPEHPYPAAMDDALSVYRDLTAAGVRPILGGDSAGAGLALSCALALRDRGERLPPALFLLSPWVDFTLQGRSYQTRASRDPMLRRAWLEQAANWYCGARTTPLNLLESQLAGLPPILIQWGSDEIVSSDSENLAQRAQAAGVRVESQRFDGMWHVFQLQSGRLRAADQALVAIARFLDVTAGSKPFC